MNDIQSQHDSRGVPIEEVGISGLRYPVTFDDGTINQATTADIEMTVALLSSWSIRPTDFVIVCEAAFSLWRAPPSDKSGPGRFEAFEA